MILRKELPFWWVLQYWIWFCLHAHFFQNVAGQPLAFALNSKFFFGDMHFWVVMSSFIIMFITKPFTVLIIRVLCFFYWLFNYNNLKKHISSQKTVFICFLSYRTLFVFDWCSLELNVHTGEYVDISKNWQNLFLMLFIFDFVVLLIFLLFIYKCLLVACLSFLGFFIWNFFFMYYYNFFNKK